MRAISLAAALALVVTAAGAGAQPYPEKPVTMLVPYSAGSTTDIIARGFADAV